MSGGVRSATAVAAMTVALSGCAGAAAGEHYAPATAASLQQQLLVVAKTAASHNYAGALQQLSNLQQADDAALTDGAITASRHAAIASAISQVRADLSLLQTQAQARAAQQRRTTLLASRPATPAPLRVVTPAHTTARPPAPHHHSKHGGGGHGGADKNGD